MPRALHVATQFTNPFVKIEITQTIPMATKHLIQQTTETGTSWTPYPSWGEPSEVKDLAGKSPTIEEGR